MIKETISRIWMDIKKYGWIVIIVIIYYVLAHAFLPATRPLILTTGFPCAGCGMSRAVLFVLTGRFSRAFYLNPLAFLVVLFGGYCCFCRYIKGVRIKGLAAGIIILSILLFLFYCIRMYLYFPDRIPYVYTRRNMLEERVPWYGDFVRKILLYFREQ